jgi:hypothetical protein
MASPEAAAITNATQLSEIGFPEFTAKLITDTFNAITASYINQMAQYVSVVQIVSQTVQDYINNTRDDITADEINGFLVALAGLNQDALNFLLGDPATSPQLSSAEAAAINSAVALPAAAGSAAPSSAPASAGTLSATRRTTITQAIARRIANNKYDLLQTMVRQGLLRLYVDNGTIETRLTFSTYGDSFGSSSFTNLNRAEQSSATAFGGGVGLGVFGGIGAMLAGFGGGSAGSKSTLTVSTVNQTARDVSGSRVQIYGRVKLNFKTDLLPLAAAPPP